MKAIYKLIYDTENYDEVSAIKDMMRVADYKLVLWDLDQYLRSQVKYNDKLSDAEQKAYEDVRERLHSLLGEYNVSLE